MYVLLSDTLNINIIMLKMVQNVFDVYILQKVNK